MKLIWRRVHEKDEAFTGKGIMINSGKFSGMDSEKAKKEIIKFVGGKEKTTFKLRDWVFSRQRYWGEPIPLINCGKCGFVPVPEKDLPVVLPKVVKYKPTDNGESPLAEMKSWVNVKCPKCKGKAKRETDTMPNWAGSSWYFLRYTDPKNNKEFASKKHLKYWLGQDKLGSLAPKKELSSQVGGVDWYNGGMEHTTLHLLYSRFWHKFLYDLKLVPTSEPYMKRTSHGMILAEQGEKMSKSKGNTVNPDDLIKIFGADTLRMYEMFMGSFDQSVSWNTDSMVGPRRFLERVWKIGSKFLEKKNFSGLLHPSDGTFPVQNSSFPKILNKTIKKVSEDIEDMRFNTAISSMMMLVNEMEKSEISSEDFKKFLQILAPFAPHITEELWQRTVLKRVSPRTVLKKNSIHLSVWPKWDENLIQDEEIKIVVQINGKLRAEIMIKADEKEEEIKKEALQNSTVLKHIAGKELKKVIYVKNRLINIVI
ncbi:class I tRNA ligase family protein [Candidatus Nomurabacteria bacterium]|nr:class I tRNA ligase family protein [Candidatus Nomurabacteria bacterium]